MTAPKTPKPIGPGSASAARNPAPRPAAAPAAAPAGEPAAPPPRALAMPREQLLAACERGLDLCRFGNFKEGLAELAALGDLTRVKDVPSAYFSYMGYALAKQRNQIAQGIKLCRHAIKLEFFQSENYVNLARTCLLSEKYRREAWEAVREGLRMDPEHPELLDLERKLGSRKPPVIGFLGRNNPLNRLLGSMRHLLSRDVKVGGKDEKPAQQRRSRRPSEVVTQA
jgi:hypothetical protein